MPDNPDDFIVYGESYPIAMDKELDGSNVQHMPLSCYGEPMPLAMDAALPRERNATMPITPKKPPARRYLARDEDGDNDYAAVLAFLRELLTPDDLVKVGRMLGVEVDTTGMDRRGGMASDASLDGEERTLRERHRAGHITEGQYAQGVRDIRRRRGAIAQDSRSVVSPLDKLEAQFPHARRLKI